MSGPASGPEGVTAPAVRPGPTPAAARVVQPRTAAVGGIPVRRTVPQRTLRTVGPWCFVDHMGPADVGPEGLAVGPHPHIGLATVTWLLEGAALHRDSLGSLQEIRPGQLNLMHAGRGVVHAEEGVPGWTGRVHGVQLWVAQPDATRTGEPAFEHHADLPRADVGGADLTLLVGRIAELVSPARADSPQVAADLRLARPATLPLDARHEHALLVLEGALGVDGTEVPEGALLQLPVGHDGVELDPLVASRALLLGGEPLGEPLLVWWNFVGRDRAEVDDAYAAWAAADARFPSLSESPLPRVPAPRPSWWTAGRDVAQDREHPIGG